jgi:hypothetical protein
MGKRFPYKEFENTVIWNAVNHAVEDLVNNTDIEETTDRRYIKAIYAKYYSNQV